MKRRRRSIAERNKLVEQWIGLPGFVIKKLWNIKGIRRIGFDELMSLGFVALIRAAEYYDEKREGKAAFNNYAYCSIRNLYFDSINSYTPTCIKLPSRMFRKDYPVSAAVFKQAKRALVKIDVAEAEGKASAMDVVAEAGLKDECQRVVKALHSLPKRLYAVLHKACFLGKTLKQIGEEMGFTRARAGQLKIEALSRLREQFTKS